MYGDFRARTKSVIAALPDLRRELRTHVHVEYQLCLGEDVACSYDYRGAQYTVPKADLCVLHPQELHSTADAEPRPPDTVYHMLYIEPTVLMRLSEDMGGRRAGEPFFSAPVVSDPDLLGVFRTLHRAVGQDAGRLERDSLLLEALSGLISRHPQNRLALRRLASAQTRPQIARRMAAAEPGRIGRSRPRGRAVGPRGSLRRSG